MFHPVSLHLPNVDLLPSSTNSAPHRRLLFNNVLFDLRAWQFLVFTTRQGINKTIQIPSCNMMKTTSSSSSIASVEGKSKSFTPEKFNPQSSVNQPRPLKLLYHTSTWWAAVASNFLTPPCLLLTGKGLHPGAYVSGHYNSDWRNDAPVRFLPRRRRMYNPSLYFSPLPFSVSHFTGEAHFPPFSFPSYRRPLISAWQEDSVLFQGDWECLLSSEVAPCGAL